MRPALRRAVAIACLVLLAVTLVSATTSSESIQDELLQPSSGTTYAAALPPAPVPAAQQQAQPPVLQFQPPAPAQLQASQPPQAQAAPPAAAPSQPARKSTKSGRKNTTVKRRGKSGKKTRGKQRKQRRSPLSPADLAFTAALQQSHAATDRRIATASERLVRDGALAGAQAQSQFCTCDRRMHSREICDAMEESCRASLCNPVCLSSAWSVELEVDCAAAPKWTHCGRFRDEVAEAARALTAQFQAHVCVEARLCNATAPLVHWVDAHAHGHKFPELMLPVASCMSDLGRLHEAVGAATCAACTKVVTAKIRRGTCLPGFVPGFEVVEKSGLQQRVRATLSTGMGHMYCCTNGWK